MKTRGQLFARSNRGAQLLLVAGLLLFSYSARSQLAVTEMMSSTWKILGETSVTNSDFWELTNFGTNTLDIHNYWFSDSKNVLRHLASSTSVLMIAPGESIIFVRNDWTKSEAQFRSWWGACVASSLQIRFYSKPGFASTGDGIRVYDSALKVVASVDFPAATFGISFTYNTNTGSFGELSIADQAGACRANSAVDTASPGRTTGPIPLQITRQPASVVVCEESEASFEVVAVGMPPPRYQWYFNDVLLSGANAARLTVSAANAAGPATFRVQVSNGLSTLQSSNATLTLLTAPSAPAILVPPADLAVMATRTARFSALACAYPRSEYQWLFNGVVLPDATNNTLALPGCTLAMSGAEVCLRVSNPLGSSMACAHLQVTERPALRFTEVQSLPLPACVAHHDWFEITYFGSGSVDLHGFRISDEFTFSGALVVTQSLVLHPMESVVFVKDPTPDAFTQWWGADRLPPGVRLIPYAGFSLSRYGDVLYLWDAAAEDPYDPIDSISFGANTPGVSVHYDNGACFYGCDSVVGQDGAFRAQECGDVGSPGYISNPPPRLLRLTLGPAAAHLEWRAVEGKNYMVEYNNTPDPGVWTTLGNRLATNTILSITDPGATPGGGQRFYRVREVGP